MATLDDLVYTFRRELNIIVKVNGVLLQSSTTALADNGIPAVDSIRASKSLDSPSPVCDIGISHLATWIRRGQEVTVDVGYTGALARRVFTGHVQSRERRVAGATLRCAGRTFSLFRTTEMDAFDCSGKTVRTSINDILEMVGVTHNNVDVTANQLNTSGQEEMLLENMSAAQMVQTLYELDGSRLFETNFGTTVIRPMEEIPAPTALYEYSTADQTTAIVLGGSDREDANYYRNKVVVTGINITPEDPEAEPITATALQVDDGGLIQPPMAADTRIAFPYNNQLIDTQTMAETLALILLNRYARIPRYLTLEIAGDPRVEIGQTIGLDFAHMGISASRWFVSGVSHSISNDASQGYRTTLTLRGGDQIGGTLDIAPVATFSATAEVENMGGVEVTVFHFDASASYDPDGTIADPGGYVWTSNQPITIPNGSNVTVTADTAGWVGNFEVELTTTDNDGGTSSTSQVVPYGNTTGTVIPAIYAAINNNASASLDGAKTWNNFAGSTCISVAARPADGINFGHALYGYSNGTIRRTTDGLATSPTLVYTTAAGVAINDIQWDWRNPNVCWAIDENAIVYISVDAGVTWVIYQSLRTFQFGANSSVVSSKFQVASGIHNGTGADDEEVTGIGFRPDMVMIKRTNATGNGTWFRTSNMATNLSRSFVGVAPTTDGIKSLDNDGFTLGVNAAVNASGQTYRWMAIKDRDGLGTNMKFGSYTGNNPSSQSVTGVGFTPAMVILAGGSGSGTDVPHFKTTSMSSTDSRNFGGAGTAVANGVTSLDTDGFGVGTRLDINTSGQLYYYIAFRASANFKVGSYSGDNTDDRNITDFGLDPDWVLVRSGSTGTGSDDHARWRGPAAGWPDSNSSAFAVTTADSADAIQSLITGGIQVGAQDDVNETGQTYYWAAIDADITIAVPGATSVPAALGNKLGLPAAGGVYVFGGTGAGSPLIAYDPIVGSQQWVNQQFTGHLATDTVTTPGDATLRIIDAVAAGGLLGAHIILSWASGGGASITAVYYSTSIPGPTAEYSRATTTFGGLKTGRFVVQNTTTAYCAFANRSVWTSTNGLDWTEATNIFPANTTPWHAIWLGLNQGLTAASVFFVALEDTVTPNNGYIVKTTNGFTSVTSIRPTTGAITNTWPASAIGKKLSIGAAGQTVVSQHILVQEGTTGASGGTFDVCELVGTWGRKGQTTVSNMPVRIQRAGTHLYRMLTLVGIDSYTKPAFCQLQRSVDGGIQWFDTGPTPYDGGAAAVWGCTSLTVGPTGILYATYSALQSNNAGDDPEIWRSIDDGNSWQLIYTTATTDSGWYRAFLSVCAHPTNKDIIAVVGHSQPGVLKIWTSIDATATSPSFTVQSPSNGVQSVSGHREAVLLPTGRLVAICTESIRYTDDYGATAMITPTTEPTSNVYGWRIIRAGGTNTLFYSMGSAADGYIWRSTSGGKDWDLLLNGESLSAGGTITSLYYDPTSGNLYFSTSSGSTDRIGMISDAVAREGNLVPADITNLELNIETFIPSSIAWSGGITV